MRYLFLKSDAAAIPSTAKLIQATVEEAAV